MIFEQIRVGGDRNFAYLVGDKSSKQALVVDPSFDPKKVLQLAQKHHLSITYLINTHNHYDHTNGNDYILKNTQASLVAPDQGTLRIGTLTATIIPTPGHTPDAICILIGNKLITGDTLFVGKIGGTRAHEAARMEYDSLHSKLMTLPDTVEIWPGHDYGVAPSSTIGHEKATNPFLLCDSFHCTRQKNVKSRCNLQ